MTHLYMTDFCLWQVDYAELEKYKQEYYTKQLDKLNQEQQQRQKHQELLQAASSNSAMIKSGNVYK